MTRRRTLGTQIAWLVVFATALGMLAFTSVAAFVVWLDERADGAGRADKPKRPKPHPGGKKGVKRDDTIDEIVEDLGAAVLVATPLGLLVAVAAARWAARRTTRRIDSLIATASRMNAADLRGRLPVSLHQDELDDLAASLNQVFGRIDEGIAALRRFAADASHELRTPLAVMINALEVARRRPREAQEWEGVTDRTLDELRQMADLVEGLLQGARVGAFDLAAVPVEVDVELASAADRWREAATAAGVSIVVDGESLASTRIDPRGLTIVLGNLVGNAIGHSPRGGTVTLRATSQDDRIRIEVDDEGPGVAAPDRERIFAPFARGESTHKENRPGVGLGLSIARRIVLVGSSRVDLQACKLEYSIVSPK